MYEIAVRGHLPDDWRFWFDGFAVASFPSPEGPLTTLIGPVVDQAHLHGVLARIRDLALPIEWIRHVTDDEWDQPNTPLDT